MGLTGEPFTFDTALAMLDEPARDQVPAAIVALEGDLAGVPSDGPMRGQWVKAMDEALKPIGAKVAPSMSPEQGRAWRAAVVQALSDLPARIGLLATRKAIHEPMQFLNEAETIIRRIGAELITRRREAIFRLMRLVDEIERLRNPPVMLAAPEPEQPLSPEEIRELNLIMKRVGAKTRYAADGQGFELEPGEFDPCGEPEQPEKRAAA